MRSSSFRFLPVTISILIGLLYMEASVLYAQNSTLKECSDELLKARQATGNTKLPDQSGFAANFNPISQKPPKSQQDWEECVKGRHIPTLAFRTLAGESYDTAALVGKILVINFWFMGCEPCRAEFPALNRLVKEYQGKNVLFLGFANDKADKLKATFFQQNQFDFKIIADASSTANSFHFHGYPTTYIVDGQGIIRDVWSGLGINRFEPYYKAKSAIDNLLVTGKN